MGTLEWTGFGALLLGLVWFCAKIMRKGITTLDDHRSQYLANMRQEEKKLGEDVKNISASEHMQIIYSAISDLISLDGNPPGYSVLKEGKKVILQTPQGNWEIELLMRERQLKGSTKMLHGREHWRLTGFGIMEEHDNIGALVKSFNAHLHPEEQQPQ